MYQDLPNKNVLSKYEADGIKRCGENEVFGDKSEEELWSILRQNGCRSYGSISIERLTKWI
ncbi:hypothetical protein CASFOL_013951 [Castilleja foliolosa]|uniref:Uncharacterized protein n=1 Tax=Castilleja foliolosa TaxID=1961234 RepID=A0ABD3DQI4_9LAMI